jgi:uncharacterized protein YebE (UPF0316 family)
VGAVIEGLLAVGYLSIQVFPSRDKVADTINKLRSEGFGFTNVVGAGRGGPRNILFVTLKRKDLNRMLKILDEVDPKTFYNISDARNIRGGVFPTGCRK